MTRVALVIGGARSGKSAHAEALALRLAGARGACVYIATAEAFDGCCLVRRDDRLVASLAAGDPLHESLGRHAGLLLGIRAAGADPSASPDSLAAVLLREQATIWLARIDQVRALAAEPARAARLATHLQAVVMPIGRAADLARAREASDRFREAFGVQPVVAYAPPEVGGLVAMNTPPARIDWDHETITKPETVGRVVNGVVVWPRAADRAALRRPPLVAAGAAEPASGSLVISATSPGRRGGSPQAVVLSDAFDVDKDGFLVPRDG